MGTLPTLTQKQQTILEQISQNNYFKSHFYFTGGTALSTFYFQHRYSDDLDFFSEEKIEAAVILPLMEDLAKKEGFIFKSRFVEVVYIFDLEFKDKSQLKVDFGYYPYQRIESGSLFEDLPVDSLLDIAVNKLLTVSQRTEVKDFVDLYFLLQKYTVWTLMEGVNRKFKQKTDPFLIASDFLKVDNFEFLPKMISGLKLENLKAFFKERAQVLAQSALN